MAGLIVLTLALLAGTATSQESRIVGGWPARQEDWRFIAQVDYRNVFGGTWSQSCAANIISTRYLVSAAHCFMAPAENRQIRAGSTNRNAGGVVIAVQWYLNHPTYGQNEADGDINVVRLATPLEFSPAIDRVPILIQGAEVPDGTEVKHAGWGRTTPDGFASPELLETSIYTVNREVCQERYANQSRTVTENMICVGLLDEGGRDACQGDSGGPLLYGSGDNKILVGIVSWGLSCALPTHPGVNTRVSSYTNWILENVVL